MEEKKKRPAIPENVKRELWIKSGGVVNLEVAINIFIKME